MPRRFPAVLALLLLLAAGCAKSTDAALRDGDIVFQTSRSGQSVAIQRATHSKYSHMGIVFLRHGKPYVYEAIGPVQYTPLDRWAARGAGGHYVVKRLRDAARLLTPKAVARLRRVAERFRGKPYDFTFGWSDKRIYCSELVWKIYRRGLGVRVGRLQKLGDFDLSDGLVRAKLRERYGSQIPLDETVISPGAMFASPALELVAQH